MSFQYSPGGGGLLGTTLLGWNHTGYVEYNDYCQQVIRQRIEDGVINNAPIFGDIDAFISEGYAEAYQGLVDVITAGFPCQPHSQIGKHKGEHDPRNKWPQTKTTIKIIQPEEVLLENTKGLTTKGYILTIIRDLREIGYQVWPLLLLSSSCCGADHERYRVWIYAAKDTDATRRRLERWINSFEGRQTENGSVSTLVQNFARPDVSNPHAYGSNDGLAYRMDRTRAVGNGQDPNVVKTAWEYFTCLK